MTADPDKRRRPVFALSELNAKKILQKSENDFAEVLARQKSSERPTRRRPDSALFKLDARN
jgi:hypothetical protein